MAVTETRSLFNPKIESLAEQYAGAMGTQATTPFTPQQVADMAPQVAPQTALQQQATTRTTAGLGAYSPYVTRADAGLAGAGTDLATAQAGLGAIGTQYADPARQAAVQAQGTLGGVSPYITAAGTGLATAGGTGALGLGAAGAELTGAQAGLGAAGAELTGAQAAMGGVSPYITQAAGLTGAGANLAAAGATPTAGSIAEYMSPYQQQVIDTSLAEFDRQAAARQQAISDQAVAMGGFGGGREGVMQSEYQTQSDKNRALLDYQMRQQGFGQAQQARQADMASRLGIGGAQQQYASGLAGLAGQRAGLAGQQAALAQGQLGLGAAQQGLAGAQLGAGQAYLAPGQMMAGIAGQQAGAAGQRAALAQSQLGIAGAQQGFQGADIARAGSVGAADQAYEQAREDAKREANRMAAYEPYERIGWLGQGVMGMMGGMAPQYSFTQQSNPNPLAQALGIGIGGAKVYKDLTN